MAQENTNVTVEATLTQPVRHTIAASRLLYTPPSWVLRGPIYMIFWIMIGALIYSFIGRTDALVAAPMTLHRAATTYQAVGGGMILEISANTNSVARFDELLISVQEQTRMSESTESEAMTERRFEMEKELAIVSDEYDNTIAQLKLQLEDLTTNRDSRKISLEGQIKQIEQQLATGQRTQRRDQERLGLARKQFERRKALYEARDITVTEYEAAQEQVFDAEKSIDDMRSEIAGIRVQLATTKDELAKLLDLRTKEQLERELQQTRARKTRDSKTISDKITEIGMKLERGQQLVDGVTFKDNITEYRSRFNGLIVDIHVKRGELISPGQPLVTMVRESAPIEGIALVANEDIGSLKKGQNVKIKFFAFPYQEYGIHEGVITDIATKPDASQNAMYPIRVALTSETVTKRGGKPKSLFIGLEGIAEIKIGEKRLIELVFAPVSRFFDAEEEDV